MIRALVTALLLAALPARVAGAGDPAGPGAAVAAALAEAADQLAAGEPQIAESRYREALLEAWHLRGLLSVADGDLPAARDAFERSARSAAVGVLAPRIDLALVLHRLGDTDDALQRLRALTRHFRSEPVVWEKLIGTLVADGRMDEAREQLQDLRLVLREAAAALEAGLAGVDSEEARKALQPRIDVSRMGDGAEAHERLEAELVEAVARAYQGLQSLRSRAEESAQRLEALLSSIDSAGDAPESLSQATRAIRQGQVRDAEALLRRAQKQGHDSAASTELLGIVREAGGDGVRARLEVARIAGRESPKAALELLAGALRRAPSSEEVLAAQARVAMSVGLTDTAVQALEPLVGIFLGVAEYPYLLGKARVRQGAMTDAVSALQTAVALAPGETSYRFALAEALNHEKRFDEAELHLVQVLEQSPGDLAAAAALAQAEEGLDKLDLAEQYARSVLGRAPDHAAALLVIGMVRMKQERYAEASETLEKALAADPGAAKAHYQLSLAYMRLGQRDHAKHHLDLYHAAQEGAEGEAGQLTLESSTAPDDREKSP